MMARTIMIGALGGWWAGGGRVVSVGSAGGGAHTGRGGEHRGTRKEVTTMQALLQYARCALSVLTTIAFGVSID
jgi:hypothetical protein